MHKKLSFAALLLCYTAAVNAASPQIIAHRGGTGDMPENTLPAIQKALDNHAGAIWLTLQLSKDGVPVLYRPSDLSSLTSSQGKVSEQNVAELEKIDAGYKFAPPDYPWRGKSATIPALETVLNKWPKTFFYLDIKSPDADPAVFGKMLLNVLEKNHALNRVRVYSTDAKYLNALPTNIPRFETRDETRTILANITMDHQCQVTNNSQQAHWYGLELKREVEVVEKFTLGEGRSKAFLTWDKEAMDCFKSSGQSHVILLGINSEEDYQKAKTLGADGVLVDSPAKFATIKK
ncbi:glycerophosphodiester phosphodiesterase family protein [Buttiauxella brennerae]|uniref:glycerophosphodiester phosphodiesterase family protein n=1 Tax=Buttiauxella brennerae TaxID=82988 RepID=UPI00286F38AA|nr:glycerophosphodiester phosphodiesterase family protein [Buttiauxella brennerae]